VEILLESLATENVVKGAVGAFRFPEMSPIEPVRVSQWEWLEIEGATVVSLESTERR